MKKESVRRQSISASLIAMTMCGLMITSHAAAAVMTIDDHFTGATAPWDSGSWSKAIQGTLVEDTDAYPPEDGEVIFSHDGSGTGSMTVAFDPSGNQGAGIVSTAALDSSAAALNGITAALTFDSSIKFTINRLILCDNAALNLGSGQNIYAQIRQDASSLGVVLVSRTTSTTTLLSTSIAIADSISAGDVLSMTLDGTYVTALNFYNASAGETYSLLSSPIAHSLNLATDFDSGIYLGAHAAVTGAATGVRGSTFDSLQATIPEPATLSLFLISSCGLLLLRRRRG